jgi:hypothetical protein
MKKILKKVLPNILMDTYRKSSIYEKNYARKLALTTKRVDICSAQMAHSFHLSGIPSISGKVCLEIGAGWVLSHSLVLHILGAKKVIATDIANHACANELSTALQHSIFSIINDVLSPFDDHEMIKKRLRKLFSIKHFDGDALKELNIEYIAPLDLSQKRLNIPIDFIFSNSVLEHIPSKDVPAVLRNLNQDLKAGGEMLHCIHLEDHKDAAANPFAFLSIPNKQYFPSNESDRGNRLRKSGWEKEFQKLENLTTKLFYSWSCNDKKLPDTIDSSVQYSNESDLRVSHIGINVKKSI